MARKNGNATVKGELVEEIIPFPLTELEMSELARDIANIHTQLRQLGDRLKKTTKEMKADITKTEQELYKKLDAAETGIEYRMTRATKVLDGDTVVFYVDDKRVHERPATELDKQSKFPFMTKTRKGPQTAEVQVEV